jgi:hypothetical protein
MKRLLALVAVAEALTGLALLIVPTLVARLLLGAELNGVSIPIARVLGIALLALGVCCWPGSTALCGMLTYGALVTVYLAYLSLVGGFTGILLWPAVMVHALLTLLLLRAWLNKRKTDRGAEKGGVGR